MSYLGADEKVVRIGSRRAAEPALVGLPEAAKLLGVSRRTVRKMAQAGELAGTLVEVEREKRAAPTGDAHPWQKQDAREIAQLAARRGQEAVYELRSRKVAGKAKAEEEGPHATRWRFLRADVMRLKARRARRARAKAARKTRARIFGAASVNFQKLPRVHAPRVERVRCADEEAAAPISDPAVSSNTKLLAWAAPSQQ